MEIRPFEPSFEAAVIDLIVPIQRQEFGIDIDAAAQPDLSDIPSFYQRGAGNFWIALEDSRVVGTIALLDIGNHQAALRKMFVAREFRGAERGVAARLLRRLLEWATQHQVVELFLGTTDAFQAAHRFYEKHGFSEIPRARLPKAFSFMKVDTKFYMLGLLPRRDAAPAGLLRKATLTDVPAIQSLIEISARALGSTDYTSEQIEAALLGAWGVDTELIKDGTYFVGVEDELILCGGWSRRATHFGGDAQKGRESRLLDPHTEAARIRAFFVHPRAARRGLASRLLTLCEAEAKAAGFTTTELVATLPGERLYARHGYASLGRGHYKLPGDVSIDFVPMKKTLK